MRASAATGRRQSGFLLVLALFLIVSLAAIAVYLVTISTAQVEAGAQDEQAARAYQAARTGIDWGAYQVLQNPGGAFATATCNATGTPSQQLTLAGGLANFFAEVSCRVAGPEIEGAVSVRTYQIIVTGCNSNPCGGTGATYVERQLQVTLAN